MHLYTNSVSTKCYLGVVLEPLCREISPLYAPGPTDFRRRTKNNEAKNTNVIKSKLSLERWNVCDLSQGVSQVTVNDPVIQMLLLIKKFTYLVAEGKDNETKCFEFMAKRYILVN